MTLSPALPGGGYYAYGAAAMKNNIKAAQGFVCPDCGHTTDKPYPPLPTEEKTVALSNPHLQSLTCYITKMKFENRDSNAIFGLGICQSGSQVCTDLNVITHASTA